MLAQKKFVVAGLVRNCEKHVKAEIRRIKDALSGAQHVSWLLIESDSSDATLSALADLKNEIPDFDYISLGVLRDRLQVRTERLAYCRNTFRREISSNPKYEDADYVIVSDLDGTNPDLTAASIASCWERDDWDGCTANQRGPYYDVWTLRHNEWSPNDCFEQYRFYLGMKQRAFKAYYKSIYARMIRLPLDSEWIEVDAAFGGFAIYKKAVMAHSEYIGVTSDGKEICEHVLFSQKLRHQGYRIFINPRLINSGKSMHTYQALAKLVALFFLGQKGLDLLKRILR